MAELAYPICRIKAKLVSCLTCVGEYKTEKLHNNTCQPLQLPHEYGGGGSAVLLRSTAVVQGVIGGKHGCVVKWANVPVYDGH